MEELWEKGINFGMQVNGSIFKNGNILFCHNNF